MKIFKFLAVALVAMCGLGSCSEDCDHNFIDYDYTNTLVGTWTCLEEDQSEAMVINPDGSFEVTGIMKGGALYEEKGTIKVVNNKVTIAYNSGDVFEGRLELVAGKSLSIVINEEYDIRLTYDYCDNDLADEVVGMWVCNEGVSGAEKDMGIITYSEGGKAMFTGNNVTENNDNLSGLESTYKVVGNILFQTISYPSNSGVDSYMAIKLTYAPNNTSLGDIMTQTTYLPKAEGVQKSTSSWLRVKQSLNFTDKKYAYKSAYVTNAKGTNEDFSMMGSTFNMSTIEGVDFDEMFADDLYSVELNGNSIKHIFHPNGQEVEVVTPVTVDGNKVTLDMSAVNPACRKVEMYMFQDADDSQLHIYMHTNAFINYFANLGLPEEIASGRIDQNDAVAIEKFYTDMEARIESINVSFVFKARK